MASESATRCSESCSATEPLHTPGRMRRRLARARLVPVWSLINQRYVGFYNAQCCGVQFEYQSFNYPNNPGYLLPRDRRFNMSFR